MCELRHPSGLTILTKTTKGTPSNESQVQCQIEHNQVCESSITQTLSYSIQLDCYSGDIYNWSDGSPIKLNVN